MCKIVGNSSVLRAFLIALSVCGATWADVQIVTRAEWSAQPPKGELTKLTLPLKRVIVLHTAGMACSDEETCGAQLRGLQNYQMKTSNFDDIAYNYLVGNDGHVYEGRGWEQQGAFAIGFNAGSLGLAFICNFNQTAPPDQALSAAQALIAQGVQEGKIDAEYKLLGHRQLTATNSPGDALYAIIKQWPHWSRKIN